MDSLEKINLERSVSNFKRYVLGSKLRMLNSFIKCKTLQERKFIASRSMKDPAVIRQLCKRGCPNMLLYILLECGVGIADFSEAREAILSAVKAGSFRPLATLIKFGILQGLFADNNDLNLVVAACFSKNILLARYLRLNGFNINSTDNVDLCSNDHIYCQNALALGADLNYTDSFGRTVFINANASGDVRLINVLLRWKFDQYIRDKDGANALCWLFMHNQKSLLRVLPQYLYPVDEYASALEYCGARTIIFESKINLGLAFWKESLEIRQGGSNDPVNKTPFKDGMIFIDLGQEFRTQKDLYKLKYDIKGVHFQALLVFLRILKLDFAIVPCSFAEAAIADCFRNYLHTSLLFITQSFQFCSYEDPDMTVVLKAMHSLDYIFARDLKHLDKQDSSTASNHLNLLVDMIEDNIWPILESCSSINITFLVNYKQLLEIVARYLSIILSCENRICRLRSQIKNLAGKYFETFPTSLLHVVIEKKLPQSVIDFVISCGGDIRVKDANNITALYKIKQIKQNNLFFKNINTVVNDVEPTTA